VGKGSLITSREQERIVILAVGEERVGVLDCTSTERLVRSPVLADRDQTWMVLCKGLRWCTGCANTGIKCWAECLVLANREMATGPACRIR
jgi:hypothetical protein